MVEYSLSDNEATRERSLLLPSFLLCTLKHLFQALHIVVIKPADCAARDLQALLNGKVDTSVSDNDIATLAERRNDGGNRRESLGIDNS